MSSWNADDELLLCESLEEQAECYAEGIRIVQGLEGQFASGACPDVMLSELQGILHRTARIEDDGRRVRQQWNRAHAQAGPRLRKATATLRQTLEQLMEKVREAEQAAATAKDRLAPQLTAQARGAQMRRAYATASGQRQS